MANVIVKVSGQEGLTEQSADSVGELKTKMGLGSYTASVNNRPVGDDQQLFDSNIVTFAPAVKGGLV